MKALGRGALAASTLASLCALLLPSSFAADEFPPQPQVPYLSPSESQAKFLFAEPGYSLELILSEPEIKEPTICVFDGNGRMYVGEMRTYMQEIDGKDEHAPRSRVSVHWSSRGDGVYDQHRVFADGLVLPRMILPLDDGVLINQTDSNDIYLYKDTDGDGVSDTRQLWFSGGPRGGNLEHQPSGLIWSLDNWLYTTYNAQRLRLQGTNVIKEPTAPNGGQWGLTQDDDGKPWYVDAGGERGPVNFQQPIVYGAFQIQGQFEPGFAEVWPAIGLADVQGGYSRFRPTDKTLNHFTATCGAAVFRGDRLPEDLRGDLFFAEPVGRLIRRARIEVKDGATILHNPYPKSEFIRSTDPNFRPVNMTTAPDGTLYIVDMYRGIIQEGGWVREGSYLRKVVQQYGLDKNAGRGRIWRLRHEKTRLDAPPRLLQASSTELVRSLGHPNGWWRETAQKLLVLRNDSSVIPALIRMAREDANPKARVHAIWTLEGMNALPADLVEKSLQDPDAHVRVAAIRASETLYKAGDATLVSAVKALRADPDPTVVIQAMMTANLLKWQNASNFIAQISTNSASLGVKEIGRQLLTPPERRSNAAFTAMERRLFDKGQASYKELCFACHGNQGEGMKVEGSTVALGPPLRRSKTVLGHQDGVLNVLLAGLSGPVEETVYPAQMVSMASNDDEWIASVASYVRNSFGNRAGFVLPREVAARRKALNGRTEPWTIEELRAAVPQSLIFNKSYKVTSSHHQESARLAIDGDFNSRFDTAASQAPGMWFQVEFPEALEVSSLVLDSQRSPQDYPRGYQVQASSDGETWGSPLATGKGNRPITEISFPPTKTKFIRITQTGAVDGLFWSIHELQIYQPAKPLPVPVRQVKLPEFE